MSPLDIPPPPEKRENRVNLSFSDRELETLQALADSRGEQLAVTVRKLALAAAKATNGGSW